MLNPLEIALYRNRTRPSGFTLIELLTVMGIIVILTGIVIGVQRGVSSQQDSARARSEMHAIANALEAFKLQYGDYPWQSADSDTARAEELFDFLTGEKIIQNDGSGNVVVLSAGEEDVPANLPNFIDVSKMNVDDPTDPTMFVDPWGTPYHYFYIPTGSTNNKDSWVNPGFILLSSGRDGLHVEATGVNYNTGAIPSNADDYYIDGDESNQDNILHGLEF